MNPLVVLALATPVWGFALQPPMALTSSIAPAQLAALGDGVPEPLPDAVDAADVAHNNTIMDHTRAFQLAGTIAMAVTGVLGAIQFADEYGFNAHYANTACRTGQSVMDYCGSSTPIPHLVAAGSAALLGGTAFILTTQVNFDLASRVDGDWRTYEVTRWLGLGMTIVQAVLGFFTASAIRFGWADEQRDFQTLQGLAITHLALGVATIGVETFNTALVF